MSAPGFALGTPAAGQVLRFVLQPEGDLRTASAIARTCKALRDTSRTRTLRLVFGRAGPPPSWRYAGPGSLWLHARARELMDARNRVLDVGSPTWSLDVSLLDWDGVKIAKLGALTLHGRHIITDIQAQGIAAACTALAGIDLSWCRDLSDSGVGALARCGLRDVNLYGCSKVTDVGLKKLATHGRLESVDLFGVCVTDDGLGALRACTRLTSLSLPRSRHVTGKGLAELAQNCTALRRLDLTRCSRVGEGVPALRFCSKIETLILEDCNVQDEGVAALRFCTALKQLDIKGNTNVGDAGVSALAACTGLLELNVMGLKKLSDKGLGALSTLTLLQTLNIERCKRITDKGVLAQAAGSASLKVLDLRGCNLVTQRISRFLPGARVIWY